MLNFTLIIVAYLLGSISSAIIVCKVSGLPDPRSTGSMNPGATNVLRIGSKWHAFFTLLGDLLKGLIPTALAVFFNFPGWVIALVMLLAFLGHLYPVFFNFKGGKGVATAIGAVLGLNFLFGLSIVFIWLIVALLFRYSSLGALVAFALGPFIYLFIFAGQINILNPIFISLLAISILIFIKHKDNINNLINGQEKQIGYKEKT